MKKNLLLLTVVVLVSYGCGNDDAPVVDPLVGTWELFNASGDVLEPDFAYLEFENSADIYGEESYTFEFNADQSYERILERVPLSNGSLGNIDDSGTWELDDDDLDLDVDGDAILGLSYRFKVTEISGTDLNLEFDEQSSAFPQTKINEWFADGTLDSNGNFTVTNEEFDSLVTNFAQTINIVYSLNFDKM